MIKVEGKTRNILLIIGAVLLIFLLWYFSTIVTYILISAVLSLMGRPLIRWIRNIKIGRFTISQNFAALFTLLIIWVIFIGTITFLIPLLVNEFNQLSTINLEEIIDEVEEPIGQLLKITGNENTISNNGSFLDIIKNQLGDKIGFDQLTSVFSFLVGAIGEFIIAFFSISFITFFFLKEENLFREGILLFVPTDYEDKVSKILESINHLLKRYLIGIMAEVFMVGSLVTLGLTIVGIGFNHAIVIGVFCGLFNIIPYLGPWMGASLGLLIGIAINLHADFMSYTLPILGFMLLVFAVVQIIDNILFQPLIYSSSVKAHPIEIFLVILAAGSVAGILGMILAIPVYTILRVVAKEFLDNLKIVKRLTRNLN